MDTLGTPINMYVGYSGVLIFIYRFGLSTDCYDRKYSNTIYIFKLKKTSFLVLLLPCVVCDHIKQSHT